MLFELQASKLLRTPSTSMPVQSSWTAEKQQHLRLVNTPCHHQLMSPISTKPHPGRRRCHLQRTTYHQSQPEARDRGPTLPWTSQTCNRGANRQLQLQKRSIASSLKAPSCQMPLQHQASIL